MVTPVSNSKQEQNNSTQQFSSYAQCMEEANRISDVGDMYHQAAGGVYALSAGVAAAGTYAAATGVGVPAAFGFSGVATAVYVISNRLAAGGNDARDREQRVEATCQEIK
jgi:hypothetical protein